MNAKRPWLTTCLLLSLFIVAGCNVIESIVPPPPPEAVITATPPSGSLVAPATVTFDASASQGTITGYEWFVNGVSLGTGIELSQVFDTAGNHEVRLVVSNDRSEGESTLVYTVLTNSAFDITLVFAEGAFTASQQALIQAAATRWEQLVTGDIPDSNSLPEAVRNGCLMAIGGLEGAIRPELEHVDYVDDLVVFVNLYNEESSTLAFAGPCYWNNNLPNYGRIQVNEFQLQRMIDADALTQVMVHELGHVLGVGTLWRARAAELLTYSEAHCTDSSLDPDLLRTYKGQGAVLEYQALGGESAPPIDTHCGHWHEDTFGNELLTPTTIFGTAVPDPVSRMTLASLADLGYQVALELADEYELPLTTELRPAHQHRYHHGKPVIYLPTASEP